MATITIDGNEYFSYADEDTADEYLAASSGATAWRAAATIDKQRALVSATRFLDRLKWLPAWDTQEEREAEQKVVDACCEIAAMIVAGEPLEPQSTLAGETKRLKAGSVEIEYFRGGSGVFVIPKLILDLLAGLLAGQGAGIGLSFASGTDRRSGFRRGFGVNRPF